MSRSALPVGMRTSWSKRSGKTPGCRCLRMSGLLFELPFAKRWQASWQFLGVDVEKLSLTRRECLIPPEPIRASRWPSTTVGGALAWPPVTR